MKKNLYKICFTGYEDNIVYVLQHKKKFSKQEINNMLEALLQANARRIRMNNWISSVGTYELQELTIENLYGLGFENYEDFTIVSKFIEFRYGSEMTNILKCRTEEDYIKILKTYYDYDIDDDEWDEEE